LATFDFKAQQNLRTEKTMIDKRKKEHPRTTKLTLNTDKETAQKLRAEAGRKGLSISEHLNNKLKA
jgi:hypothetical protein